MKKSFYLFFLEYKFLFLISFINFLLVYLSSFVKGYGYFIDEFYYIACALKPAMGYVDNPPLAPLILTVYHLIFGTSLLAIRILPALAESASVFYTGILAKELGGNRFSQCLAACAVAASPMIVAFGGFYSMNAYELLLAIILMILAVRMIKENNPRRWVAIGIVMGLGIMNKHTFALFILAIVFSLLAAGKWKLFLNRWFVMGSLLAFIIFLPNIIWQILNHYPSLEFYKNISAHKNIYTPPLEFFSGQVIGMSVATFPIWLAGIIYLMLSKSTKDFRFLAILFLFLFIFMMLTGTSRSDRMSFAYPAVISGGALFFESLIIRHKLKWLKGILIIFLYAGLAIALPIILPYFNYEQVRAYTKFIGLNTEIEAGNKPPIPQLLADRIGWEDKFNLVLNAYNSLTDKEKKQTIIAAGNYGQAGAIELYGKKYNLSPVVCGHNNYYLWSKNRLHGNIILDLAHANDLKELQSAFNNVVEYPGEYINTYVTSHENHLAVFICRGPKMPLAELLKSAKHYY